MKCLCHFPSLLQDDSEVAPKISGCSTASTPRLLASGPLEEISSISLIAEGMVVKKSDTIRAILPSCERSGMFACRVLLYVLTCTTQKGPTGHSKNIYMF